jgi:NAD(P)-dependent dehydrogenase (short-subunit alcohol dehydrogenase family)
MDKDLSNKRIVITGITGGIAKASAQRLTAEGAEIIVTARSEEKLEKALANISGNVSGYVMDLQDEESVKTFFSQVGDFDHLVTPAAASMFAPIREMDFTAARELIETKQWGQMLCVHYALPYLSKSGSITLFSGTVTQKPLTGATMFSAAGAASEASGRIWAYELAPIRVNTIVPGVIETDIWAALYGSAETAKEQMSAIANILPVGHVGASDDVAKAVSFLIDNTFVNGISLVIDGGHRLI